MADFAQWSPYTVYNIGDVVFYAGFTYAAQSVNVNTPPYPVNAAWILSNPTGGGNVSNPLQSSLDCGQFELQNSGAVKSDVVRTDELSILPGSLSLGILCSDNFQMAPTKELRFLSDATITSTTGVVKVESIPAAPTSLANVVSYDTTSKRLYYQAAGGGGGGVSNPLTANLDAAQYDLTNVGTVSFSSPSAAPTDWSINGVYNIDAGTLPYPVARFSSSKASGSQQKSLTLEMSDGEAIWSSQWEGYIPQAIRTKQNLYTIAGQGAGAQTTINCDTVSITPNAASATQMGLTGTMTINGGLLAFNQSIGDCRVDGCKEVKSYGGANLNLNVDGGGSLLFTTNANQRGSLNSAGVWTFASDPQCSSAPSTADSLTNRAYVDTKVGSVLGTAYINVAGTTSPSISLNYTPSVNTFYVSKQGSDTTGTGTSILPFASIGKAVQAAEAVSASSNPCFIYVDAGIYTETVSITKGYISIISMAQTPTTPGAAQITGAVNIACAGSNDLYGRVVSFIGMTIVGTITDNSSVQHTLSFRNCYLSSGGRNLYVYNAAGATDCRVYMIDCIVSQNSSGTAAAVEQTYGWLSLEQTYISTAANQPALALSGASYLVRTLACQFEASHTGSSPVVFITSTSSAPHSFGQSAFVYTNPTGKVNGVSCGIAVARNPAGAISMTILQCFFSLAGTTNPAGHTVETTGSVGNVNVAYGGSLANPLYAYQITTTGTTKVPLQNVS